MRQLVERLPNIKVSNWNTLQGEHAASSLSLTLNKCQVMHHASVCTSDCLTV